MKLEILHAALFTPMRRGWGLPILIEDEPGTAKTSVVEAYAERLSLPCEVLSPGERGEGAFGVVPVPIKGVLSYPPPDWTAKMENGGIVFVDEVTTAPPILQAPMLGLVAGKRIGSKQLGPRVRVIGACNPVEQAANGFSLSPPLANRFGWLKWDAPSIEEHAAYMLGAASNEGGAKIDSEAEEARVEKAWAMEYARAVGLETSFHSALVGWKNRCPKVNDARASRAWPSDRTWEMATRAYAAAAVHGLSETHRDLFTAAFIGNEAYEAFATHVEQADLPPVLDLLDERIAFEHKPARLDRSTAILHSCAAYLTSPKSEKKTERANVLWGMLGRVGASSLDLVVPIAQALIKSSLHTSKSAVPVLAKIQPILDATRGR